MSSFLFATKANTRGGAHDAGNAIVARIDNGAQKRVKVACLASVNMPEPLGQVRLGFCRGLPQTHPGVNTVVHVTRGRLDAPGAAVDLVQARLYARGQMPKWKPLLATQNGHVHRPPVFFFLDLKAVPAGSRLKRERLPRRRSNVGSRPIRHRHPRGGLEDDMCNVGTQSIGMDSVIRHWNVATVRVQKGFIRRARRRACGFTVFKNYKSTKQSCSTRTPVLVPCACRTSETSAGTSCNS